MPETGTNLPACSYVFEKEGIARDSSCKRTYDLSAFLPKPSLSPDQPPSKGQKKANRSYDAFQT